MVDEATLELGTFQMTPAEVPMAGALFERDGEVYEVTMIKDCGGFFEGGIREFQFFGKRVEKSGG